MSADRRAVGERAAGGWRKKSSSRTLDRNGLLASHPDLVSVCGVSCGLGADACVLALG